MMRRNWASKVIPGFGLLLAAAVLWAPANADDKAAALYKQKCAACHGADGKGDTPTGKALKVKDFASEEMKKTSDEDMSEAVTKGKGKMPGYGKSLKPEEIKALVAYIRGMAK